MKFNKAYLKLRGGQKIAIPEWDGYWYWDDNLKTIIVHCANDKEFDIRKSDDVAFTLSFICREDWIIAK